MVIECSVLVGKLIISGMSCFLLVNCHPRESTFLRRPCQEDVAEIAT